MCWLANQRVPCNAGWSYTLGLDLVLQIAGFIIITAAVKVDSNDSDKWWAVAAEVAVVIFAMASGVCTSIHLWTQRPKAAVAPA